MLSGNVHTEITERLHELPKIDMPLKAKRDILSTTIQLYNCYNTRETKQAFTHLHSFC